MSGKNKKCRPLSTYPVPAIRCTGTYYAIPIPLSSRSFPIFESVQQKYFWENCSHNFWLWSYLRGYWFRCVTRKGKWSFHLRPDTNLYVLPSSSKIPLPLKVGEYPAAARQWVQEPTYAKYSAIYIKRPFKPSYVVKNCCLWTLPHFGCLWRLLATHVAAMTLKVILCQSFRKCVSNLVFGINREYLDKPLSHMFPKMMIANIYVLGPWT